MDIFKIQLDKAINKGNIDKFLLKKRKSKKNSNNINKYADYIIDNCYNFDWLTDYVLLYGIDDFANSIVNNYKKIESKCSDCSFILRGICSYPNDKLESYLDKIIYDLSPHYIDVLLDEIQGNNELINYLIDKYVSDPLVGGKLSSVMVSKNICVSRLEEHINDIINNNMQDLFLLLRTNRLSQAAVDKIKTSIGDNEDYLDSTVNIILKDIYSNYNNDNFKVGKDTIKILIKEICRNEKKSYGDIEYIGRGTFSYVIGIGDKVLKIGKKRNAPSFPNNPYIIAPLLRESITIDKDNNLFLEVTEKVDTKCEISDEELYVLYKNLRQLSLVWTDMAKRNIGRLTKDNYIHWNTAINPNDSSLELGERRGNTVLKKGQLVILDADHLYDERSPKAKKELAVSEYEKRYQNEISGGKGKEKHYYLNDLFDCRITNNTLHLHVVPKSVKEDINKMGVRNYFGYADEKLSDALTSVYDIVLNDEPNIKNIFAVSPLLSKQIVKDMFNKRGFDTSIKPDKRFEEMFGTDKIGQAIISKDKFVFLEQEKRNADKNKENVKTKTRTLDRNMGFINIILISGIIIFLIFLGFILFSIK